jgi:hypothetical protein
VNPRIITCDQMRTKNVAYKGPTGLMVFLA